MTCCNDDVLFARSLMKSQGHSVAPSDSQIRKVIENDLLPFLRVAVRTHRPPSGPYVPAEGGECSSHGLNSHPGEENYAEIVARDRRRFERDHNLVVGGHRPASGLVVLYSPPGIRGALGWLNGGMDDSQVYGDTLTVLGPEIIERSVLLAGDSYNLDVMGVYLGSVLTPARAAVLLAVCGSGMTGVSELPGEVEYLEALITGGLNFDEENTLTVKEFEQPRCVNDFFHKITPRDGCYLSRQLRVRSLQAGRT